MKYIIITGGVISGLGKGITASSIGLLFKSCNISVTSVKIDPYLNIDAGTMSPYEHGECYVLGDGGEVDLDIGNYERFLGIELTSDHNITTGKIYNNVINKERAGDYLGKTVQIVPHIINEIKNWIVKISTNPVDIETVKPQVCIIEIGGTVGDIETMPFIEAIRQMSMSDEDKFCFVHVAPIVDNNGEYKTKPIQHSLEKLRSYGIIPNMLVVRAPSNLSKENLEKLELFSNISRKYIIQNTNVKNIYYVPKLFKEQNIVEKICQVFRTEYGEYKLNKYDRIINYFDSCNRYVDIGIVGKYLDVSDTYLSIIRAIESAGIELNVKINIHWMNPETFESNYEPNELNKYDGFIIPGGFGFRGIKGKTEVIRYCKINNIPILGICLGMQIMVVDCYNSLGYKGTSTEWTSDITLDPVIDILPNQTGQKGGTMRLGNFVTILDKSSKVYDLYNNNTIIERHRHRYEVNNKYITEIEKSGLRFVGYSLTEKSKLMEIVELDNHPFYIGCQYHPEFSSKYDKPHPLFIGLTKSMIVNNNQKNFDYLTKLVMD